MAKKRAYIYVDIEKYARFKRLLDIMGVTMTDFFDDTMTVFIDKMETVIQNGDKEAFLEMMSIDTDSIQKEIEKELKR